MARFAAAAVVTALGTAAAFAVVGNSQADEPIPYGQTPTVYRTVTETHTVNRRLEGHTVGWWRVRSIANRKTADVRRITLQRIRRTMRYRWTPTVTYAIGLASRVFNVSETKMRAVAYCESTFDPFARNGRYRGIFQLGWAPFGLDPYDPVANALSAAQTVARDGSWRQWECG